MPEKFNGVTIPGAFELLDHDNGILARVPGEYVSQALKTLPKAETSTKDYETAFVDVGPPWNLGLVRITAKRSKYKRAKFTRYIWHAVHAQKEPDGT